MRNRRIVAAAALLSILLPALAESQALTSLATLRTRYSTRKATVQPSGDLKTQIDAVDQEIAAANRAGRLSEVRRLIAKGTTLLDGKPWTDVLDYTNSIVLRTEEVVSDSTRPYEVRLEQLYSPAIELTRSLTAHARLEKRGAIPPGGTLNDAPLLPVKDFGTSEGVSRDLRESPYRLELDARDVADGTFELSVEVLDQTRSLGAARLTISLLKGLDKSVADLQAAAANAPANLRADIAFPVDRTRNVNRGKLEVRTFDPPTDFPSALAVAAAVKAKKDPFAGRTGDFKRHYLLQSMNEIMPYRVYVPKGYNGSRQYPLIIALHGLGGTENSFFTNPSYEGRFAPLAEKHGYIVAAPLGFRVDGGYGAGVFSSSADPESRRASQASEEDVMQVLQLMRQHYKIDSNRIYLMGHSLGAIGTWSLGPKYPDIWAALAPIAGSGSPASLERIRTTPQIIVHGDDDRTVNVRGSRSMVAKLKEMGTEHKYIEVPGGSHSGVVAPNLPAIFEFFDAHAKK